MAPLNPRSRRVAPLGLGRKNRVLGMVGLGLTVW